MSQEARDAVMNCRELTDMRLRYCLLMIADRSTSNREGPYYSFPGQGDVAYRCAKSVRTIERWIGLLVELGYLTRVRRHDGMAYFILLSTDGVRLPPPPANIMAEGPPANIVTGTEFPTRQHSDGSHPPFSISHPPFSISHPPFLEPFKGVEQSENRTENREEASTFPQNNGAQKPQPDPNSANVWTQLCDLLTERYNLTPLLSRELRRARLDLWPQHNHADVILPRAMNAAAADVYAARFIDQIDLHLSDVTDQDWGVRVWTQAEIDAAEQEIHA